MISDARFYTSSDYYEKEEIEVQIKNNIRDLNLPAIAKVNNIAVEKTTAIEISMLCPIKIAYKPLKQYANKMRWKMEEEKLRRSGVKYIKLMLFFKKLDNLLTSNMDDE
ncbi:hypothetical protein [Thomasclavelia cocleata]|uniref:hypothetical protein n=1 Tax=Thomasclavelia cocleata TaxID=69824 RepID=UPI00256EE9C1|nr:hypothetical protein [Thomasclavelia cocleata]